MSSPYLLAREAMRSISKMLAVWAFNGDIDRFEMRVNQSPLVSDTTVEITIYVGDMGKTLQWKAKWLHSIHDPYASMSTDLCEEFKKLRVGEQKGTT